jgi:hypothetical protein
MKRKNPSRELQRTLNKIEHCATHEAPDSRDRILSATATQSRLVFDMQAFECQPSVAGKKRKGYKAALHQAIDVICSQLGQPDLKSVLEFMGDEEKIDELYGRATIGIHVIEVNSGSGHIHYTQRDGMDKTASFKTIRNLISQFKTPLPD